jgi:hypothetical protein
MEKHIVQINKYTNEIGCDFNLIDELISSTIFGT